MKNGTRYAGRVKKAYARFRQTVDSPEVPEPENPLRQLAIATLSVGSSDSVGRRAVDRAMDAMVDWNDMRVSSATELNEATGNVLPRGLANCQRLITVLQSVYDRENRMSLDRLRTMARRDAKHFLEALGGIDEYGVASVLLWSLGGHAIPVGDRLLHELRTADLVHPDATKAEVQAFLERHVSAADAKTFCLVMQSFKSEKTSPAKRTSKKVVTKKKKSKVAGN